MDIDTLLDALSADEREALAGRLGATPGGEAGTAGDREEWCDGPRRRRRRGGAGGDRSRHACCGC